MTQVALALVLLVGAGLLVKSFSRLQSVDPGFNPDNLLTMRVSSADGQVRDRTRSASIFSNRQWNSMKAIPGVEAVGAINTSPFTGLYAGTNVDVDGQKLPPGSGTEDRHLRH